VKTLFFFFEHFDEMDELTDKTKSLALPDTSLVPPKLKIFDESHVKGSSLKFPCVCCGHNDDDLGKLSTHMFFSHSLLMSDLPHLPAPVKYLQCWKKKLNNAPLAQYSVPITGVSWRNEKNVETYYLIELALVKEESFRNELQKTQLVISTILII
jgi:hypothetical protein